MGAMTFNWQDLAFGSKKQLNSLQATFIVAPREMSVKRFTQLVKTELPAGNIVLGLADEPYIDGFTNQPHFRSLQYGVVAPVITKVAKSGAKHQVYILRYAQRDLAYLLEKLDFKKAVLVNGSWKHMFHASPAYYTLVNRHLPYQYVSPFTDESEAKAYAKKHAENFRVQAGSYSDEEMMALADEAATQSYDNSFQTGVTVGKKVASKYKFLLSAYNKVVPYQTYALHFGNSREQHFSPINDQNYYDTVHAEICALLQAQKQLLSLKGQTLFVNLLPCPACARILAETEIAEIVYQADHSNGYAVKLLESAGKKVRRLVL